jgi:hypothetical protein
VEVVTLRQIERGCLLVSVKRFRKVCGGYGIASIPF